MNGERKAGFLEEFALGAFIDWFAGQTRSRRCRPCPVAFVVCPIVVAVQHEQLYLVAKTPKNDDATAVGRLLAHRQAIPCRVRALAPIILRHDHAFLCLYAATTHSA